LFAAGAGKGRIHAATSRPPKQAAPSRRPEASHQRVDNSPAAVKADIRAAVAALQYEPGGWVGMAELREKLGTGRSRESVDAALLGLLDEPGVRIIPVANTKALTARDREAAVWIGGEDNHAISIEARQAPTVKAAPPRSAPAPTGGTAGRHPGYDGLAPRDLDLILSDNGIAASGMTLEQKRAALAAYDKRIGAARFGGPSRTPDTAPSGSLERTEISGWKSGKSPRRASAALDADRVGRIGALLAAATSRDEARSHLNGLTTAQLRQLAAANGAVVGSNYTKARLVDELVNWTAGRRLDSAAIHRMSNSKSARQLMSGS
jgi:hypothetical protein